MSLYHRDTICALATPPGRGGVGIVRISGPKSQEIAHHLIKKSLSPRCAHYGNFYLNDQVIDTGIALFFPKPNSFTAEDVLELQGHGGPIVLDMLIQECIRLGARLAAPGEFTQRAFLNDKIDLSQAEAIADLINASSEAAAKQAVNSLKGEFSKKINAIVDHVIHLRVYVESAIDFPEEEIDFLADGKVAAMLDTIISLCERTLHQAQQGAILQEGMNVVIAGRPNAGKSSLLNQLAARDLAIVTNIAGTTRDVLRQHIHIDGLPLHIIDTAGLRDSSDEVERIGIQRAWDEIASADRILLIIDSTDDKQSHVEQHWPEFFDNTDLRLKLTLVFNKVDKSGYEIRHNNSQVHQVAISALTGDGLSELKQHLIKVMGYEGTTEGGFSARRRHIVAIENALDSLNTAKQQLTLNAAGELVAEDLRNAQHFLSEITGNFSPDDLLGEIFSSFCIGK